MDELQWRNPCTDFAAPATDMRGSGILQCKRKHFISLAVFLKTCDDGSLSCLVRPEHSGGARVRGGHRHNVVSDPADRVIFDGAAEDKSPP
jgi:hypothetical protein